MRAIILSACLCLFGITSFSQDIKTNGTIYVNHPNIIVVQKAAKAYLAKDDATNMQLYADTARFWASGMDKPVGLKEILKEWDSDFDFFDDIKLTTVGYPDYLNYIDGDQKVVQSWWQWSGKSKKTGEVVKVDMVIFDSFNKDGKIFFESVYGDFSNLTKNKM